MPHKRQNFEALAFLEDDEYGGSKGDVGYNKPQSNKVSIIMAAGLMMFFVVDICVFISVARLLLEARYSAEDPQSMEFRNPYIGLDELYSYHKVKPSRYNTLINEPRFSAQISPAEPSRVFPIDAHRWMSDFGVLSPPDRHLQVTRDIHTIVQFNVLDYGMEKCALTLRLPERGAVMPHPYSLPETGDVVSLDICELDVKRPLKEHELSWSTRPACIRNLGTLEAKIGGQVEMKAVECKSGSFIGYQFSCTERSPECNVDVWTNHNQTWGVFINQYQTV